MALADKANIVEKFKAANPGTIPNGLETLLQELSGVVLRKQPTTACGTYSILTDFLGFRLDKQGAAFAENGYNNTNTSDKNKGQAKGLPPGLPGAGAEANAKPVARVSPSVRKVQQPNPNDENSDKDGKTHGTKSLEALNETKDSSGAQVDDEAAGKTSPSVNQVQGPDAELSDKDAKTHPTGLSKSLGALNETQDSSGANTNAKPVSRVSPSMNQVQNPIAGSPDKNAILHGLTGRFAALNETMDSILEIGKDYQNEGLDPGSTDPGTAGQQLLPDSKGITGATATGRSLRAPATETMLGTQAAGRSLRTPATEPVLGAEPTGRSLRTPATGQLQEDNVRGPGPAGVLTDRFEALNEIMESILSIGKNYSQTGGANQPNALGPASSSTREQQLLPTIIYSNGKTEDPTSRRLLGAPAIDPLLGSPATQRMRRENNVQGPGAAGIPILTAMNDSIVNRLTVINSSVGRFNNFTEPNQRGSGPRLADQSGIMGMLNPYLAQFLFQRIDRMKMVLVGQIPISEAPVDAFLLGLSLLCGIIGTYGAVNAIWNFFY